MKKITAIVLAILMCLALIGCSRTPNPERDLVSFFRALKELNTAELAKYTGNSQESLSSLEDEDFDMKLITKKLEYRVKSCTVDGEKATATVDVSNVDMYAVMKKFAADIMSFYLTGGQIPEGEENQKYSEMLAGIIDSDIERYSKTVDVNMTLKDGVWMIDNLEDLLDPTLGGLLSYDFSSLLG